MLGVVTHPAASDRMVTGPPGLPVEGPMRTDPGDGPARPGAPPAPEPRVYQHVAGLLLQLGRWDSFLAWFEELRREKRVRPLFPLPPG